MILVYPPTVRATEAPIGIARLAGFAAAAGQGVKCIDMNIASVGFILGLPSPPGQKQRALRAEKHKDRLLSTIRSLPNPDSPDHYFRALGEINYLLGVKSAPFGVKISLTDYQDARLSPVRHADLLSAASHHPENIFAPLFAAYLDTLTQDEIRDGIGISIGFLSQALPAFALAGAIRMRWPAITLVMGGGLITSWVRQGKMSEDETFGFLKCKLRPGDGRDMLIAPESGDSPGMQIPVFREFPLDEYLSPGKIIPYNLSWGCPWKKCTFCPERAENSRFVPLKADTVISELSILAREYSPDFFHITDSEITLHGLKTLSIMSPNIPWYGFTRFLPELTDPEFCRQLYDSGCRMLQLGLESGSQRVLDAMGKGTDIGLIPGILKTLKSAGIATFVYVLFGTPQEDEAAAVQTLDFLEEEADHIDWLNVAIFNMPTTSPEAAQYGSGTFYEGDLSLYCDFTHPTGWSRARVRNFLRQRVESSPRLKPIFRRTIPHFTSSLAPFFSSRSPGKARH